MSSAGRAVSSNGCVTKPKERGIGLTGCAVSIRSSSLTGSYVMETAEHREPYESRGSRTVLGAPGGETPPGDSTFASFCWCPRHVRLSSGTYREAEPAIGTLAQHRHARAHAISDPGTAFIGSKNSQPRRALSEPMRCWSGV